MAAVTSPIMTDDTGQSIARSLQTMAAGVTAPEITASKMGNVTTVTATDSVNGTTTAQINDGTSPTATITDAGNGTKTISITDTNGTTSATVVTTVAHPVVITDDDTTPPSDTTCLWVFPES